jgi:hypothetical protein
MLFSSWLRNWKRSAPAPRRTTPKHRLCLESLEDRLAPASVLVVPFSQATDATHFHLLSAAINGAGPGGTVTIEPGASADVTEPVTVDTSGVTIEGDPNTPASTLPSYQIAINTTNVRLSNLNLQSVTVGNSSGNPSTSFFGTTISTCIVGTITDFGEESTITQNTITGSVTLQRANSQSQSPPSDIITNNTFESGATTLLNIQNGFGTDIINNTFIGDGNSIGILLSNCTAFPGQFTTVANNTINLQNAVNPVNGIVISQSGSGDSSDSTVQLSDNTISTAGTGTGIFMTMTQNIRFTAQVSGNDLHGNAVGVSIICDGTTFDVPAIAMSGNDFRSFRGSPASINGAAIVLQDAPGVTVNAEGNLFENPPSAQVFITGGGAVDTSNALLGSTPAAFVQSLYLDDLGRVGSTAEINGWVAVYNASGQAAVVKGIYLSTESLGRIVDSFYLRFLGRESDPKGRAGWISFLQNGGTEQQMENGFLTSPEYLSHINTDFVQSLYINLLGRTGSSSELAGWNNLLPTLGLAGIVNGFTGSTEYRDDVATADYETFDYRQPFQSELTALATSSQDFLGFVVTIESTVDFFNGVP